MPFHGQLVSIMPFKNKVKAIYLYSVLLLLWMILRLNYFSQQWEITCGKYCPVIELRFTDILFPCLKLGNVVKHLSVLKKKKTVNLTDELSFTIQ